MSKPTDLDDLQLTPLPGSERAPAVGAAESDQPLDPSTRLQVTLVLRRKAPLPDPASSPRLTSSELADAYGADPADVALVTQTMTDLGIEVVSADAASRRVLVVGEVSLLSTVFGSALTPASISSPDGPTTDFRQRVGSLSVPGALAGVVTAVLGLDDRPQARMLSIVAAPGAVSTSYTPIQLGRVYGFPAGADGTGQTIAIVELGGGFDQADLDAYFAELGITGPTVTAVGVDGAKNVPGGDPNGADGEVLLDIEVAGALAPGADIVVYFAPNTDAGFLDAVSQAAHANPAPTVISISWGQSEDDWTAQAMNALDAAMADAATLGATVTAASGDDGSTDRATDGNAHVDFPAASPHALGCGGTRLRPTGRPGRCRARRSGTTAPGTVPAAAASATSSRFPTGSRTPASPRRRWRGPGAASPTSRPTPTRRPATRCGSTAATWSSAAPARWPRCGLRWSRGSRSRPAAASVSCNLRCTPRRPPAR